MVNELIDRGILSYRDELTFDEAVLAARAGLLARRAGWYWNDFMHVACIGGATKKPWIAFYDGFGNAPKPYDVLKARFDMGANDWVLYTHEQLYNEEFRTARHRELMPQMDPETHRPVE